VLHTRQFHKVLVHGTDIVSGVIFPLGQLSEETREFRNKDLNSQEKSFEENISVINKDVFHLSLVSSDPIFSSLRKLLKKG